MSRTATTSARSSRTWKAAAAAGAAAVLLIGGGATFAEWSDDTTVDSGATITSGRLSIDSPQQGQWSTVAGPIDIAGYRVVPGESLTYREQLTITAEGDELTATVSTNLPQLAADNELAAQLAAGATMTLNGTDVGEDLSAAVVATGDPQTLDVAVTVIFDETTAGLAAQGQSVDLADMTVRLVQNTLTN